MTPLEILKGARELLSDEEHWTKFAFASPERHNARNDVKPIARPSDPEARCYCLAGALMRVGGITTSYWSPGSDVDQPWDNVLEAAFDVATVVAPKAVDEEDDDEGEDLDDVIANFNDDPKTGHADVLGALDKAIAIAEARQ